MILEKIKNITIGNSFYGIEVSLNEDYRTYYVTHVKRKKNSISIINTFQTDIFDELIKRLSIDIPVVLSFSGSGIINKKERDDPNYRSKILFNSNPDDFYWNEFHGDEDIFVSIARKTTIDDELNNWKKINFSIIKAYIGPFIAVTSQKILNINSLKTSRYNLVFEEESLKSFLIIDNQSKEDYIVDDQKLNSDNIIGFSSIVDYLFPNEAILTTIDSVGENRDEFVYKNIFSKLGVGYVVTLFGLLLISFFLLEGYQNNIKSTTTELAEKQVAYNQVLKLKKDKVNKEEILRKSGIHNTSFLSYYVWQLTDIISDEIQLEKLEVFPINGKIKKLQPITFKTNQINISGYVKVNKSLSQWIGKIKKYKWIESVEIIDFKNENKANKFILRIVIKTNV